MSTIDELKDTYLTTKHEAKVAHDKATEARIAYYDALDAKCLEEIAAKGVVVGETVVKVSQPGRINKDKTISLGRHMVTGTKILGDDMVVPIFSKVTKDGKASKAPGGSTYGHDYTYEIDQ
jgi:hypothetical protein